MRAHSRREAAVLAQLQVRRAGAEHVHVLRRYDLPQRLGTADWSVVEDDLRADWQARRAASSTSSTRRRCGRRAGLRAVRSTCRRCSLTCSSSVPPAPCTRHFGRPVVPEEKSTNSGWLNGKPHPVGRVVPSAPSDQIRQPVHGHAQVPGRRAVIERDQSAQRRQAADSSPTRVGERRERPSRAATRFAIRTAGPSCSKRLSEGRAHVRGGARESGAERSRGKPAITTSALLPATATTRSPGDDPISRNASATR